MAVTSQARTYKDYTSNPIPTSLYPCYSSVGYDVRLLETGIRCRDGVTCVVFVCPALPGHCCPLSSFCGFGMAILTSLYKFGKCFSYLIMFSLYKGTVTVEVAMLG